MPESANEQAASVCKETVTIPTYPPGPADRNPMFKEHLDGSITTWLGNHNPLERLKSMVGIRLYPGKLYNHTPCRIVFPGRSTLPRTGISKKSSGLERSNLAAPL